MVFNDVVFYSSVILHVIQMKYGGPKDTVVQFLFYQPIRYQWRETDFFPCSVTCGGGILHIRLDMLIFFLQPFPVKLG